MGYSLDFSWVGYYLPAFGRAIIITVQLTVYSSLFGTILGIPIAILLRKRTIIRLPTQIVVDMIRAIPNLVLIFFCYYFPYEALFNIQPLTPFTAALIALIIAQAAYSADAFRAAIDQVPRQQILGVRALGFKESHVARFVILPSIVRQTLPIHVALWIGNLKLSSLASVIGVKDVVFVAKVSMAQSYRSIEAWIVVAIVFVALVLPCTYGLRLLERSAWIQRQ